MVRRAKLFYLGLAHRVARFESLLRPEDVLHFWRSWLLEYGAMMKMRGYKWIALAAIVTALQGCMQPTQDPSQFENSSGSADIVQQIAAPTTVVKRRLAAFAEQCWENRRTNQTIMSGIHMRSINFGMRGGLQTQNGVTRLVLMQARLDRGLLGPSEPPWTVMMSTKIESNGAGGTTLTTKRVFNYVGMEDKVAAWASGQATTCD